MAQFLPEGDLGRNNEEAESSAGFVKAQPLEALTDRIRRSFSSVTSGLRWRGERRKMEQHFRALDKQSGGGLFMPNVVRTYASRMVQGVGMLWTLGMLAQTAEASTDCWTSPKSISRLAGHDSESPGEFYEDGTLIYYAKVSGDYSLFMTHLDASGARSGEQELPQLKTTDWYQTDCSDLGDGRIVIEESNTTGAHRLHVKDLATGEDGEILDWSTLTVGHLNSDSGNYIMLGGGRDFSFTKIDDWYDGFGELDIERPVGDVGDMHEMSDGRALISVEPDGSSRSYDIYTVQKTFTGATPADSKWEGYKSFPYNSSGRDVHPVCTVTANGEICLYAQSSSATSSTYTMQMTKTDKDCDGMADGEDPCPTDPSPTCGTVIDDDGDGYSPPDDCNDTDPVIHPGATEICNDKDDDCDRSTDEGVTTTFYRDRDGDGYGNPADESTQACSKPPGYVSDNTDCDDARSSVNPGKPEVTCDDLNNDCKSSTEDNPDQDGDGVKLCSGDCADTDADRYSGNDEVCGDGKDQDCSGSDQKCPDTPTPTPTDEPTPTTVPTPSASPTPSPSSESDLDGDGIPDDIDGSIDSGQVSVEGIDESDVTIDGAGNIIVTDDILEGTQEGVITQLEGDFIYPGGILSGVEGMVMQQNGDTMLFSSVSGMRVKVEWNSLTRKNIITNEGTEMVTYRQNDDCEALFIQPGQQMDLQGIFAVTNPDDCVDQPDPTSTPSPSPTEQPTTDSPTPIPTPVVTPTPTHGGTDTPSPSPSQYPTDTPDPSSITPTPDPSVSPSVDPTSSPTPPPDTQEPTTIPGPTSEPHPSPDPKDTQSESGGGAGCGCETVPGQTPIDVQGQTRGAFALALATMGTWFSQRRRKMVP